MTIRALPPDCLPQGTFGIYLRITQHLAPALAVQQLIISDAHMTTPHNCKALTVAAVGKDRTFPVSRRLFLVGWLRLTVR